ncbi:N-6 DNA methylase [Escherichia fergusonii]|nr:N-6 DNA methylase [Escherichia fergusonii]MCP9661521.1 N-6 DNA methylase [Escherichia fergusonii]
MNKLSMWVFRCSSVSEILKYIRAIASHRAPIKYGVEKVEGKSYDRLRREANQKAIDLLNSLVDGATLTDEQRQILAGYTGEGGIGGSVSEYYTPKPIAEGVWEIMKLYGADVGNTLEPSAGTGVFNETKPVGTVMTATEISSVSGRINQLLHPEDSVQISPFEQLAISTPNDSFDHVVGNVPFGGRDNTRNIDKPYAEETDMGSYFMLRMLDKIKPGGFMCVIVPPSIVSGSNMKRLRLRLSRKAEFLGAHRLPTGTFDANGTSTVVDVVLMRKHPAEMAEKIPLVDESTLESANVLWPTFISGKWFEKDGRRFVHGTQEKGFQGRIEVRADGQIDNQALKAKLIHRFESRIDWSLLDMAEPSPTADIVGEGEMRLINGVWQKYAGGRWIGADAGKELKIDAASYGADSWEALQRNLTTTEGRLGMTFTQMANVRDKYTTSISDDMVQLVDWINWDVKTLDKQVDVTPDEDAVMQKISGGVSIAGINDIISCDDFYRFQQRGMIKITDSYGVQTTESGYSIDFVGTYTDPLKHAVYPDRRDGALKSSIAKWVLGMMSEGNNRQVRLAEVFLTELFGSNYGDVIASYGDTLSPEAIQEKIADAIARMPEKTSQGATRNGDSELEVTNAIFGTHEFRASDYEITTAQFGTIGIYSNKDEIKQAMDAASARIAAEREANLSHAVAALTQSWVTAIREAATTGKITPAIADVVNDGSKFMDAYKMDSVQLPSAYGQLSYRMTYNLVSMFSDLAILGLVELNEVTPELLSMRKNHVEILQRINTVLAGRTDEEKQADADRINLALGNITEEEIAARNEKQEELSSIQGDATSIAQSLGLNYRVSTADLKMMYAPKFAAGEVFGLQEASGMKGILFRAKDAIKAKFGARWLPAKAKNSDFPGNWWIIETKHNVADVLAVIQQYA